MKKTNLTFLKSLKLWIGTFLVFSTLAASAQCSMQCGAHKNVSVDANCEALITPEMYGAQLPACTSPFVVVRDKNGNAIPNATVTVEHIGQTLEVELHAGGNMCWGYITVEDKMKPVITCPTGVIQVACSEAANYRPEYDDNCGKTDVQFIITEDYVFNNDCQSGYPINVMKVISRRFIAVDKYGNQSEPCVVEIHVVTNTQPINRPPNYMHLGGGSISCDANYNKDENGHPHPLPSADGTKFGTGVPTVGTKPLYKEGYQDCGLIATYSDVNLGTTKCVTKIMRNWTVVSWTCQQSGIIDQWAQIIEIADNNAPTYDIPRQITAATSGHKCEGTFELPYPTNQKDNCGSVAKITVSNYDKQPFIENLQPGMTLTLPEGSHIIYYDVYDECGNLNSTLVNVDVIDNTPPVPVCIENTVVSLTSDGNAWLEAKVFDKGSYDECRLKTMVVRRMNPNTCNDCEIPEFDHLTYKGTLNGKYYYVSNHKFLYATSLKHITALTGNMTDTTKASAAVKNWLNINVFDSNKDGVVNADDEKYQTLNRPVTATSSTNEVEAKYVFELTNLCGFSKHVKFCCNDLVAPNNPAVVVFRVIDHAGNWNECMVNTTVQDKIGPFLTCPNDTTVNCDISYDLNNMAATFGSPITSDNCQNFNVTDTSVEYLNSCRIGHIIRTITISNPDGSNAKSCQQRINLTAITPFNGRIGWPKDATVNKCVVPGDSSEIHPNVLGYPSYTDGACDLVGHRYTDETFTFNNPVGEACFKILRTWEVIDWCQKYKSTEPNPYTGGYGGYARWQHTQTIKVIDSVSPEISACRDTMVCTYDSECTDGYIALGATATDSCTNVLTWSYKVDLDNNGSFDSGLTSGGTKLSDSGQANSIDASGRYPIGTHRIQYTFEDKCGNLSSCEQIFSIVNCKAPTPYCNAVTIPLMPVLDAEGKVTGGMIETWASDLAAQSQHTCKYDVILSFEPITKDANGKIVAVTGKTFTCADLGDNRVKVYAGIVTPMGDIRQDYCETVVTIQNNQVDGNGDKFICPGDPGHARISGTIVTEAGRKVADASVSLVGSELSNQMTSEEGAYAFPEMATGGRYTIVPKKDDKADNGVNTRDLITIQRHLLELEKITSPYQLIAADANNDGTVSPRDLLLIRKVILKLTDKFESNKSWRFVDKGYTFNNPTKPLSEAFPELYEIDKFTSDMAVDFVAIKTGDVNNTAKVAKLKSDNVGTRSVTTMTVADASYEAGSQVVVPVSMEKTTDVAGFQFTIDYDASLVKLVDVTSDAIDIDSDNLALLSDEGVATISWNTVRDLSFDAGEPVFNLVFESIASGNISSALTFNSNITEAELYTINYTSDLNLEVENRNADAARFALHQNTPNPFKGSTQVAIDMPTSSTGSLSIVDITGKLVKRINTTFVEGRNVIHISNNDLGAKGVYYYTVKAGEFTATKKMVVIQ